MVFMIYSLSTDVFLWIVWQQYNMGDDHNHETFFHKYCQVYTVMI